MNKPKQDSELISAAEALDATFPRFEQLSEGIQKLPLNSQKNLVRASEMLSEIAKLGEALRSQLGSIVEALANAAAKYAAGLNASADILGQTVARARSADRIAT